MKFIVNRLKEASTWAGISALLLGNALVMGEEYQALLGGLATITGVIAVLLKDQNNVD